MPASSARIVTPAVLYRILCPGLLAALLAAASGCSTDGANSNGGGAVRQEDRQDQALVLALAVLGEDENGKPKPLPARVNILAPNGSAWNSRFIEDPASTAFHKAMAYRTADGSGGVLTFSGEAAAVKLWTPAGDTKTLWEANFGGDFSRMRDAEIADLYGDGSQAIVVVTHDQGVVATVRADSRGNVQVEELDRQPGVIVHEVEIGDLDGDGVLEVYATPSAPNRMDGTPQRGQVVRYIPQLREGRQEIVDLGERHAKEILVDDLDQDGRDELYVSVEAVSGGQVEIRRYSQAAAEPSLETIARIDDTLCRFLTAGDVDGDGDRELVAATNKSGLWLLRPQAGEWSTSLIDSNSSGFEHASILLDLDGDGRDELYVASDRQSQVRRYDWVDGKWEMEILFEYEEGLTGFTWNIMPVPRDLLPGD